MAAIVRQLGRTEDEIAEWELRCDMAAVFRVAARLDWNEQIGNHNSVMLPGSPDRPLGVNLNGDAIHVPRNLPPAALP